MHATSQTAARSVGFAGLGAMGFGMASNLLKAGIAVNGFDVSPKALEKLTSIGGEASSSIQDASCAESRFFVMVATPEQVDSLVFCKSGLSSSLPESAIICLFSTLPPAYVVGLKTRLEESGRPDIRLLDCPVSGGVIGANGGALSIMLGGDDTSIEEIRPELEAISAPGRLFTTGPLGSASTVKMLNQHLAGSHIVVAAEVLAFAKALGLSSREAYRIITSSEGGSWIMGDRGISMLNAEFSPKSAITIFTKDLGIVNASADAVSLSCPIAATALQAFTERAARGYGRDDDASVVCNYEEIISASVAEPPDEVSIPSPVDSSPDRHRVIVLVTEDARQKKRIEKRLLEQSKDEASKLQILIIEKQEMYSRLEGIENALVGISGDLDQCHRLCKDLSTRFPSHQVFDYQLVLSNKHDAEQLLYSSLNNDINAVLQGNLGSDISPVSIQGTFGAATKMYLAVRLASLTHLAAAAECYALAVAKGVSVKLFYELISGAAGSSSQFNEYFPKMLRREFELDSDQLIHHSTLRDALNDLKSLTTTARSMRFPAPLLDVTYQIFKKVNKSSDETISSAAVMTFWD